jgi:hypothetical protein
MIKKPEKPFFPSHGMAHSWKSNRNPGFALVITLSLMILLTVIAVGLLSLSSISLRQSAATSEMSAAMANARLSLMLAIGQLQMNVGPDTRITVAADQLPKSTNDGSGSGADVSRRQWTGVYDAWLAPSSASAADPRPTPVFRQWLVSGNTSDLTNLDFAKSSTGTTRQMVGKGTLGTAATTGLVSVPVLEMKSGTQTTSRLAWWVGDQGVKAAISMPKPEDPVSNVLVRAGLQGAPHNAIQLAKAGVTTPFGTLDANDPNLAKVTDWQQAGLLVPGSPKAPAPLFHDLVSHSSGLLTNVRSGGFRKDLSMYLETSVPPASGFPVPLDSAKGALYRVNDQDGIRIGEIWSYYNLYKQLKTSSINFTTGGSASGASNPHLQAEGTMAAATGDNFFYFKRPVIISYKALFSFYVTPPTGSPPLRRLAFVVDPVVTFWNPYDVPISLAPAYNSIRFMKIPYQINNLKMTVNGASTVIGTVKLGGTTSTSFGGQFAANYVTLRTGPVNPVVMRPGEVLLYAQPPNTLPQAADGSGGVTTVNGKAGYNFGGGIFYPVKNSGGTVVTIPASTSGSQAVTLEYTGISPTKDGIIQGVAGTTPVSVNHCETYLFEDRKSLGPFLGIGGAFVDFWRGQPPYTSDKSGRFTADQKTNVFKSFPAGSVMIDAQATATNDLKKPFLYYAYDAKTEEDSQRPGQFLSRLNPSAPMVDFGDLSDSELDALPFEVRIESDTSSGLNSVIDQEPATGRGYFGGGSTGTFGSTFVTTHSVPREPLVSMAALQHSMANGFNRDKPDANGASYGLSPANEYTNHSVRLPMLPQISHAIGNSLASALLAKDKTEGTLSVGRAIADHSYLANKALWDDWFFSGIAPRDKGPTATAESQKVLAGKFFNGNSKLPVARYMPDLGNESAEAVIDRLFSGTAPKAEATVLAAAFLRVEGMFNVNSTSVEAWKAMLGGLRKHPLVNRDSDGRETVEATADTPVVGLITPTRNDSNDSNVDVKDPDQWTGRRSLSDVEIQSLAEKLVEEVRKRGPFLSLADFVNRRPGSDEALARAGSVQSAIDAAELNGGYSFRSAIASSSLPFPAAESESPSAQGAPGIIKQADILTPIAPVLSARSDSFIIRGYGEKLDATGTKVLARAWCEAVVERGKDFVDPADKPETALSELKAAVNQRFGRRMMIRSFRWLNPSEI